MSRIRLTALVTAACLVSAGLVAGTATISAGSSDVERSASHKSKKKGKSKNKGKRGRSAIATLDPLGAGSTAKGLGYVKQKRKKATLSIALLGLAPGSTHALHIHKGSCAKQGAIAASFPDVTADASGSVLAKLTAAAKKNIARKRYYVQAHTAASPSFGVPIACGNLRKA